MWHASIAAAGKVSAIEVTSPYMERNTSWPETVGLGTCMEVDNLMSRDYCAPPCPLPFLLLVVVLVVVVEMVMLLRLEVVVLLLVFFGHWLWCSSLTRPARC